MDKKEYEDGLEIAEETITEVHPGPLAPILVRIEQIDSDTEILAAHAKASVESYETLLRIYRDLEARLHIVEGKTYSLAIQPGRKPCPHCGRLLPNPKAIRCPMCGGSIPS